MSIKHAAIINIDRLSFHYGHGAAYTFGMLLMARCFVPMFGRNHPGINANEVLMLLEHNFKSLDPEHEWYKCLHCSQLIPVHNCSFLREDGSILEVDTTILLSLMRPIETNSELTETEKKA